MVKKYTSRQICVIILVAPITQEITDLLEWNFTITNDL